jgi:hypothetical protein
MKEKKEGTLKSSSGKKIKSRKQNVAIALSEARKSGAKILKRKRAKAKGADLAGRSSPADADAKAHKPWLRSQKS